jgi:hypothetical protein
MAEVWRWNPKKIEANRLLGGPQRHTLLVGGSRSGKTALICRAILTRALRVERSRHAMLRLRGNAARASLWLDTLPKVARTCYPGLSLKDHRQDGYLSLPNKSEIWIGGLDDRDRVEKILGQEYASIYFNEGSQIPYASIQVALTRLAQTTELQQRAYYDLNPVGKSHWSYRLFIEKIDPESRIALADADTDYRHMFLNPLDNAENLTPEYLRSLESMPESRKRRFFSGLYTEEIEGALWTLTSLEAAKITPEEVPKTLTRVVVAVDPSGTDGEDENRSDEVGIVVVGRDDKNPSTAYVLADLTCSLPPEGWGRRVVWAYNRYQADAVVAERNFGGDMVRYVIQTSAPPNQAVPVYTVTASRGKAQRAEPVSALYGSTEAEIPTRVKHVWGPGTDNDLSRLEDELLQFSTYGYQGTRSPNRADALIWGVSHLMLNDHAIAMAAPILVTWQPPSPDHAPAPQPGMEADPKTITLQPWEYDKIIDARGW